MKRSAYLFPRARHLGQSRIARALPGWQKWRISTIMSSWVLAAASLPARPIRRWALAAIARQWVSDLGETEASLSMVVVSPIRMGRA